MSLTTQNNRFKLSPSRVSGSDQPIENDYKRSTAKKEKTDVDAWTKLTTG